MATAMTAFIILTGTLIGLTLLAIPSTPPSGKVTLTNVVTEVNGSTGDLKVTAEVQETGKRVTVWGSENSSIVSPTWQGGEAWPATVENGKEVYVLTSAEVSLAGLKGLMYGMGIALVVLAVLNGLYVRVALRKQRSENIIAAALS